MNSRKFLEIVEESVNTIIEEYNVKWINDDNEYFNNGEVYQFRSLNTEYDEIYVKDKEGEQYGACNQTVNRR